MDYQTAEKLSWLELEIQSVHTGVKPRSVHFPLNQPYRDHLIFCDCAFNVYRLEVPPDMNSRSPETADIISALQLPMLSFAFDDPSFIPDFRQSIWKRIGGAYPMVQGTFYATQMQYDLEYTIDPDTDLVYIRCSITNHDNVPRAGVIRCFQSCTRERDVMGYHYFPFRWDVSHWEKLKRADKSPAVVENNGFDVEENSDCAFRSEDYNTRFGCSRPYIVPSSMQLKNKNGLMRFARELQPEEQASFTLAVSFSGTWRQSLEKDFETVYRKNCAFWNSQCSDCRAEFPDPRETHIFQALQWNSLQLLLELQSPALGKVCQPSQGGSSERFYVWVWEAMCCLLPMVRLGHFKPVRKVLDFIFKLQDGGTPPEGDFQSLKGAVGTTGPRWANASGSALLLAGEYALCADDPDFLNEFLPKMFRAARWILGEVRATRCYLPDGSRKRGFGVMPFACATDGDKGYIITFTDAWSFAGVEQFARLLKKIGHPEHQEIADEVEIYRTDLSRAIDSVRREDGFIDRKLSDEGTIARSFTALCSSLLFLLTGFASPEEERFRKFIEYSERKMFDDRFGAPMFDKIHYIGNMEENMFSFYCRQAQWKKAWLAAETFRQCGMTPDLYLMQERYSTVDEAFTPWQPNASNNGRYLNLMIHRLILENGENSFILFGGISPSGLLPGRDYTLSGLHTADGKMDFSCRDGVFTLFREKPFPAGMQFIFPDHFRIVSEQLRSLPGNRFELQNSSGILKGHIEIDRSKLF